MSGTAGFVGHTGDHVERARAELVLDTVAVLVAQAAGMDPANTAHHL